MINHRPLQKQYQQKRTVKRPVKIAVIDPIESVDIANHNICDLDKYGKKIKMGSSGGGNKSKPKLICTYICIKASLIEKYNIYPAYYYHLIKTITFNKEQPIGKCFNHFGIWYKIISKN